MEQGSPPQSQTQPSRFLHPGSGKIFFCLLTLKNNNKLYCQFHRPFYYSFWVPLDFLLGCVICPLQHPFLAHTQKKENHLVSSWPLFWCSFSPPNSAVRTTSQVQLLLPSPRTLIGINITIISLQNSQNSNLSPCNLLATQRIWSCVSSLLCNSFCGCPESKPKFPCFFVTYGLCIQKGNF